MSGPFDEANEILALHGQQIKEIQDWIARQSQPPQPTRREILTGHFGKEYTTSLPWKFTTNHKGVPPIITVTLDGDATKIKWQKGALPNHRWGGRLILPENVAEAWLDYRLWIGPDFSPGTTKYGGKLPGLMSMEGTTGRKALGCGDGWSARLMWRELVGNALALEQYLYLPGKGEGPGKSVPFSKPAERGQWHDIREYVRINSRHDKSDGDITCWLNGELACVTTGLQMYCGDENNRAAALIRFVEFLIFWGGDTPDWSPDRDSELGFERIRVEVQA